MRTWKEFVISCYCKIIHPNLTSTTHIFIGWGTCVHGRLPRLHPNPSIRLCMYICRYHPPVFESTLITCKGVTNFLFWHLFVLVPVFDLQLSPSRGWPFPILRDKHKRDDVHCIFYSYWRRRPPMLLAFAMLHWGGLGKIWHRIPPSFRRQGRHDRLCYRVRNAPSLTFLLYWILWAVKRHHIFSKCRLSVEVYGWFVDLKI